MKRDHASVAEEYARSVVSGLIPAGRYVRLACQRHLDDLEWQDEESFRFRFDAGAAAKACGFIELMPHTKGKWASKGETLELEPWQVFMVCCIFGWKRKKDNLRRFRRALLIVPRKNGKSVLAAAIGNYMLAADGEYGAEVYSGATTEKQAWEVFRPAREMVRKTPAMRENYGAEVNAKTLFILGNQSRFEPIIGKPGDGASPSCAIVDEYHEHDTDHMFATMETGMGARDQPLMLVITTAGDNIAGPCYAMQDEAQKMLEGSRHDDETFALIYGIDSEDDWTDPDVVRKANPNIGVSVGEDFLLARRAEAMNSPRKAGTFRTKHLNVWVQSREAYFNVLRYQEAERVSLEDFEGQDCIVGIDLAEKRDLTWAELLFQHRDGYARFGRGYLPEETVEAPESEHFRKWRDEGLLVQTDGAVTDDREIEADIVEWAGRFSVLEVVFDPLHSRQMAVQLMEQGLVCIDFANRPTLMNEPMRMLDALIADRRLYHDGDPVFTWMLSNVVARARTGDIHSPAKERIENKIDGPVAHMMALGRWMKHDDGASVYQDRGALVM